MSGNAIRCGSLWLDVLAWLGLIVLALFLASCGSSPVRPVIQAAPPPPIVAKVAIPVACVIEQVPMPAYPGNLAKEGDDIYTLARLTMADRRVRIAERDRLRAANTSPCPGGPTP